MNPNKALWEKGDFTEIAALMRRSGEALVQSLGITTPLRVLDLGCGDGTTAVPLACLGAEVVGIDIAKNLVDAGNKRAAAEGLNRLKFQEGDACNLQGVSDHTFDLTLSVFGAMFAPKPFDVAKEMVRVTKPGGRIVMGNWIPNDPTSFVSQLLKISSTFTPPPPEGFISPMTWGVDTHIIERFGQAGVPKENISMVKDTFHFTSPDKSPADLIESFRRFYGPTMNAYEAAEKSEGRIVLKDAVVKLRKAVTSQTDARIVVLELSEVHSIEGGGLGMLIFLRRWARDHNIRFLLFNPSKSVRNGLKRIRSISEFYIPSMEEMMALLVYASSRQALAA